MIEATQIKINAKGQYFPEAEYDLEVQTYTDGSACLDLYSDGQPMITITVCIPGCSLKHGEVLIKTWSENEGLAEHLVEQGTLIDTGRRVKAGFCEAMVCTLSKHVHEAVFVSGN